MGTFVWYIWYTIRQSYALTAFNPIPDLYHIALLYQIDLVHPSAQPSQRRYCPAEPPNGHQP